MRLIDVLLAFRKTTPINIDTKKVLFKNNFLIVGTEYECRKNKKKKRIDIIKKMHLNSPVYIEQYMYKGTPAYMIVDKKRQLDIGVLSVNAASWLTDYYSKGITCVTLTDKYKNSFHVDVIVYEK